MKKLSPKTSGIVSGLATAVLALLVMLPNGLTLDEVVLVIISGLTASGIVSGTQIHKILETALAATNDQVVTSNIETSNQLQSLAGNGLTQTEDGKLHVQGAPGQIVVTPEAVGIAPDLLSVVVPSSKDTGRTVPTERD